MKLGLELLASTQVTLRLGTFFETWIATAPGTVRRSLGRDEYHLSLGVSEGRRLAATGRTHICQLDLEAAEMGENQARPALLTPTELPPDTPVIWGIRTNQFITLAALRAGARGRLLGEGRAPLEFALDDPAVTGIEVAPGRYILDISGLAPGATP